MRRLVAGIAMFGALVACPVGAQAAPPLVGQWPLDGSYEEGVSEVTPDASGNGLALRAPNGSVHVGSPARFGTGATLATNLTPLLLISPLLAPPQLTLLAWVRQNGNPGTLRYIAGRGDDGLTCGGSSFAFYTGYPNRPGLTFYVRTTSAVPAESSVLADSPSPNAVYDNQWHLLAGTFDGSSLRFYVDGQLVGEPKPVAAPINYGLSGRDFYVDGYPVDGCNFFANADDWPGGIDEVRLYDRALTATEVARLAAAPGPAAPELITDASLIASPVPTTPEPAPVPLAPPVSSSQRQPVPSGAGKVVKAPELAAATASVPGSSRRPRTEPIEEAIAASQAQASGSLRRPRPTSQVARAEEVDDLSPTDKRRVKPDPRIQARLEAMKFGLAAEVPAAEGQLVAAVATVVLEKKSGNDVKTQTITLPPAVGIAKAGGGSGEAAAAEVQFPVDGQATAAMTKKDVARAAMSVQAVTLDGAADLGQETSIRLQQILDRKAKALESLSNLLKKLQQTQDQITQNLKGGLSDAERKRQKALEAQAANLEKQARAAEQQRDAANQQATEATRAAVAALVESITAATSPAPGAAPSAGALPAASTMLSGCARCQLAATASN
ncbi:MAG: hypothetical protein JHD16_17045 [Solirubrobacteraceae bacterium]|nr:hypothetical protein [Solirubrobacteraceae bacterium]